MIRAFTLTLVALMTSLMLSCPALADEGSQGEVREEARLDDVSIEIQVSGSSSPPLSESVSQGPRYDFGPTCGAGGRAICYEGTICFKGDAEGVLYDVFLEGEKVGETCVTEQEAAEQEQVTPGRVLRAFRRLSWPRSELVIQPPGGTTLVNLPTIFYTDNTAPSRQRVTLLRQGVLIEATPTTYTWHYGDGTSTSTPTAGTPYPAFDITHEYGTVDTFAPRLDTTYTGRYRLEGGPWIAIPETLTVTGASQRLQTVTAIPTLVDY